MSSEDRWFPVERNATIGGIFLVDPETNLPYKAGVTVQQVEGGFDPSGLSTEAKQNAIISAIQNLTTQIQNNEIQEVVLTDDELPPVSGQATSTKQDQILAILNSLVSLAVDEKTFRTSGTTAVSASSLPLPTGAATSSKQDALVAAVASLKEAISGTLNVTGTVALADNDVEVSGAVSITNPSLSVTPGGTFPVSLAGSATEAKQDAILASLVNVISSIQAPQPITDNNGSITVDGNVGVSGVVQVADNGGSLTVDGTVGATQSGAWNVGLTGTPAVTVSGPVTVTDGNGPLTVDGTVAATQSGSWTTAISGTPNVNATQTGTWNVGLTGTPNVNANISNATLPVTQSGTWNVGINGTPTVTVGNSTLAVTQSGTWAMNVTSNPTATGTALTPFRNTALSSTPIQVKATAGRVHQYSLHNPNTAIAYFHIWNALPANITLGTTLPLFSIAVPMGSLVDGYWPVSPAAFSTAISISVSLNVNGTGTHGVGCLTQLGYV